MEVDNGVRVYQLAQEVGPSGTAQCLVFALHGGLKIVEELINHPELLVGLKDFQDFGGEGIGSQLTIIRFGLRTLGEHGTEMLQETICELRVGGEGDWEVENMEIARKKLNRPGFVDWSGTE